MQANISSILLPLFSIEHVQPIKFGQKGSFSESIFWIKKGDLSMYAHKTFSFCHKLIYSVFGLLVAPDLKWKVNLSKNASWRRKNKHFLGVIWYIKTATKKSRTRTRTSHLLAEIRADRAPLHSGCSETQCMVQMCSLVIQSAPKKECRSPVRQFKHELQVSL